MRALRRRSLGALLLPSLLVLTPAASVAADSGTQVQPAGHDGSHDFDFDFGTWKTHSSRLLHPLTGSGGWVEMDGITVVTKIWNGRVNLAEYRATGPAGVVELLALRVYDPATRQWSISFATPNVGTLAEQAFSADGGRSWEVNWITQYSRVGP